MPIPTPDQPVPPSIAAKIEGHNLGLMAECMGRQNTLIDVIDDANSKRIRGMSLE